MLPLIELRGDERSRYSSRSPESAWTACSNPAMSLRSNPRNSSAPCVWSSSASCSRLFWAHSLRFRPSTVGRTTSE